MEIRQKLGEYVWDIDQRFKLLDADLVKRKGYFCYEKHERRKGQLEGK